jgi:glycine betaine/proline transport system ATP-binding protein
LNNNHNNQDNQNNGSQTTEVAPSIIEVRGLWKVFGPRPEQVLASEELKLASRQEVQERTGMVVALKDISFQVRKGELFVLMGLSGSGKSTLIRCIPRLIEPTAGQVFYRRRGCA